MWDRMFRGMDVMQRSLSASWTRNAVIRNNIANIETPNFKASSVEFESILASAARNVTGFRATRTHPVHREFTTARGVDNILNVQPRLYQTRGLSMRFDGNNVDIESENVALAQNSLFYNTVTEKLNSEIRRLRTAIAEGR
ncbi:MAG: flagellar basal body rod protein FlgB [Oscillospiraceae bacterium]|nr:flagellar basal body rod protein FlgB [Oscillospiraceae bacterium]MCL2278272.1 flagellar basal body rod protein FlgB [Oscillospiraceae bacterium]